MTVRALHNAVVPQTCGVGVIGIFRDGFDDGVSVETIQHLGGTNFLMAGFTKERPAYMKAYAILIERYGEPVYQSPVRTNTRTQNKFFFAIWDTKGKK